MQEQQIARKIVAIASRLQPKVTVVGNLIKFAHQGQVVNIPLFGGTVVRSQSVLSK